MVAPDASPQPVDSGPVEAMRLRRGAGRLTGIIRARESGRPVAGAQVTVDGTGLTSVTGDDGVFRLSSLPLGTQVISARKVGFMPSDRPIDILADGSGRAEVSLDRLRAVLDTVKTVARRVYSLSFEGFAERRLRGSGYFFGAERIDSLQPFDITDVLWRVPTMRVDRLRFSKFISMPGPFGGRCRPSLFLNGSRLAFMTPRDLDQMARPADVLGVEVYIMPALAPPQFADPLAKCGSIIVWTK
jgi:hypothetical protein